MDIRGTVASVALLTCCIVTGCEAFGLYPYPSLFGFVPRPLAPNNPTPQSTTPTPRTVTPDASIPRNTPTASPPQKTPDTDPPPNTPDVNAPPNPPDANPPPKTPDVNFPPNPPVANPPGSVPSSSPNGGSNYPFYGRGTQRTFSPFPGRSGWGGFVYRYKPPPPPPETPGFQYTPSVPPDTAQDAQDFEEPHREWVYHYRGTRTKPYPERVSIAGYENAVSRNTTDNIVPFSESVVTGQVESRQDEARHYYLTPMIKHRTSSHAPFEIHPVSDPSTRTRTPIPTVEHEHETHSEQAIKLGTEFINGETNLPTNGGKSTPGGKPVFPNKSLREKDKDVLRGEPLLTEGRSSLTRPVAQTYPTQEGQSSEWAAVAPFGGSNQPFLIANSLLSLYRPRYLGDELKAMV